MNLKHLASPELLEKTKCLAREERRISTEILYHLAEIEARKAYASTHGCRSLFEYATQILRYSEGAASRRISAMHALRKQPDLAEKIHSGAVNVSNLARVETFIRREEKISGSKLSEEAKREIFGRAENTSQTKLESALCEISPHAAIREGARPVTPDLHEIKLFLTNADLKKWETLRGWLAHGLKNPGSHSELLTKVIAIAEAQIIHEKTKEKATRRRSASPLTGESAVEGHSGKSRMVGATSEPTHSRTIPRSIQRQIFRRADLRCERVDPRTEARCDSTFKLQIHHRTPFARGGSSRDTANLALYCAEHNLVQGYADFGARKMRAAGKP